MCTNLCRVSYGEWALRCALSLHSPEAGSKSFEISNPDRNRNRSHVVSMCRVAIQRAFANAIETNARNVSQQQAHEVMFPDPARGVD